MKNFLPINKKSNRKRGVTLVETAVALAVIAIMTAVASTFLTDFAKLNVNAVSRTESRLAASGALECFKFCETQADFETYAGTYGFVFEEDEYVFTSDDYKVVVTCSYDTENGKATFSANATDSAGKTFFAIENYEKRIEGGGV